MKPMKEQVLEEPITDEEHKDFIKLFENEFNHPMEIPIEFERMIAFSRYRTQKVLAKVEEEIDKIFVEEKGDSTHDLQLKAGLHSQIKQKIKGGTR